MSSLRRNMFPANRDKFATGSGINSGAWGTQKVVHDESLVHGMFTHNVPESMWKESINGIEQSSFSLAESVDGKLRLTAPVNLNDTVILDSFRSPRYQPNRGHIYSSSLFLPNPSASGIRDFGFFKDDQSGFFFRLKSDGLYACRQSISGGVIQPVTEEKIPASSLPVNLDLEKGFTYDIQIQWRGVGNAKFYIGDIIGGNSNLVYTMKLLGTSYELSTWDPANPAAFRCQNLGDRVVIECGCVDISSEGGSFSKGEYGSISVNNESGQLAITGFNTPVLAVRSKRIFNGFANTRDTLALLATAYSDQRGFMRVWQTRDDTAIILNDQVWTDFRDGSLERIIRGLNADGTVTGITTPFTFDTSKAEIVFGSRVDPDSAYSTSATFDRRTNIHQTPGDIFIFTLHKDNGGSLNGGFTYEFAEQI